ncbi:hypothetical protein B0T17DRAFT_507729 [Bombardia bombarda]|uniref:RRM domain-containing protein n=1 Tax=Bombardia bombarda TaxID=252184 RepID=A0AA39X0D3_9PEZI|nr:hypothetical protein B0T17DRAFT_507729 [Bombardia bombarda]
MSGEQAEYWSFPTNKEEFDQDDRISFSRLDNKYIAVQDDGTEYEFDDGLKRWIPIIDEELIQEQQKGYMIPGVNDDDNDGDSQSGPGGRKRKNNSNDREKQKGPPQPKQNTAVYVTGLPPDAAVDEVAEVFSRKCGVIAEEIDSGRPRIKLYTDAATGRFKGDALVVFFKPQSVDMAIMLLDDTDFRFSASGLTTGKMRVQAADMGYKKTNYDHVREGAAGAGGAVAADAAKTADGTDGRIGEGEKAKQRNNGDKQKIIRKTQKLDAKLADWDDDEPSALSASNPMLLQQQLEEQQQAGGGKKDKVVILRHMFTLAELEEDPAALLDIKDDIREECSKLGAVTNVVLFDLEEDGIVSVKFQTVEAAEACVKLMHGRAFDGRTVEATYATGKEKFRKSKSGGGGEDDE